jgi:uncharacterized membrane protein
MEPALRVALLVLLFAGTHIGLASGRLRSALFARLGEMGFNALFSVVAVVTFGVLIHEYAAHRFEGAPGLGLAGVTGVRPAAMALIVLGVTLAVAGVIVFPGSPMALFADASAPPRGLARITRHPFLVGMTLVGAGHALIASRLVGTVAFAGLALFASAGAWHQDRKLLRLRGRPYAAYAAATSGVPFVALFRGRQTLAWRELPFGALGAGLLAAVGLRAVHGGILSAGGAWVIGVTAGLPVLLVTEAWRRARRPAAAGTRLADSQR